MTEVSAADIVVTGCQVLPPSVEISTPATTPPPASFAVPLMVTAEPSENEAPWDGEVIVEVGGVVSVDAVADVSPGISEAGWAPMSASTFTVACCMAGSGGVRLPASPAPAAWSRPNDHCTVPAPNTSAPLAARYKVRWWVAVLLGCVKLP